jgi:rRNA-processing protein EBP2
MVTKSKLKLALAAEKGVDFKKLKEKKKHKEALKRKRLDGGAPLTAGVDANSDDAADEVVEELEGDTMAHNDGEGDDDFESQEDEESDAGYGVCATRRPPVFPPWYR